MKKLILFIAILFISLNCFCANYYVTSAGAGAKDGSTWANAGDTAAFIAQAKSSSRNFYIMGNETYTITESFNSSQYRPEWIGVASGTTAEPPTRSDYAYGDDRPLFACGEYAITLGAWGSIYNLRFTGTSTALITGSSYAIVFNCSGSNTSETADRYCFGSFRNAYSSSATCTNGYAIQASTVSNCFAYNSKVGTTGEAAISNIIYNCSDQGVASAAYGASIVSSNTIVDCATGIRFSYSGPDVIIANNIIVGSSVYGIDTYNYFSTIITGNNYYGYTGTRIRYSNLELNYSEINPDFVASGTYDFLPQETTLVGEADPTTFPETTTTNYSIAGAVQLDGSATGGGGRIGIGAGIGR